MNENIVTQQKESVKHIVGLYLGERRLFVLSEIFYFRSEDKTVIIRHHDGWTFAYSNVSLRQIKEYFDDEVIYIHRSMLINKSKLHKLAVRRNDSNRIFEATLYLKGLDEGLKITRRRLPDIRKFFRKGLPGREARGGVS